MKIDLVNRTVTNESDADIVLFEYIQRVTTVAPGEMVVLAPATTVITIQKEVS